MPPSTISVAKAAVFNCLPVSCVCPRQHGIALPFSSAPWCSMTMVGSVATAQCGLVRCPVRIVFAIRHAVMRKILHYHRRIVLYRSSPNTTACSAGYIAQQKSSWRHWRERVYVCVQFRLLIVINERYLSLLGVGLNRHPYLCRTTHFPTRISPANRQTQPFVRLSKTGMGQPYVDGLPRSISTTQTYHLSGPAILSSTTYQRSLPTNSVKPKLLEQSITPCERTGRCFVVESSGALRMNRFHPHETNEKRSDHISSMWAKEVLSTLPRGDHPHPTQLQSLIASTKINLGNYLSIEFFLGWDDDFPL